MDVDVDLDFESDLDVDDVYFVGHSLGAIVGELCGHAVEARGFDPATVFYCGESVLLPEYREFAPVHVFDERESLTGKQRFARLRM